MKAIVHNILRPLGFDRNQAGGFLDFIAGVALVIMPWFYVSENNIKLLATIMVLGSALILYAIFTDYKHGIIKYVIRNIHEALDQTIGVTMMALFPVKYSVPHLLLSLLGLLLCTGIYLL